MLKVIGVFACALKCSDAPAKRARAVAALNGYQETDSIETG